MSSLLDRYAVFFDADARTKGREYFSDGAVRDLRRRDNVLRAAVQGTRLYNVFIRLETVEELEPVRQQSEAGDSTVSGGGDDAQAAATTFSAGDTADVDFEIECTCPDYETTGQPCKHLWAMFLQADAQDLLDPRKPGGWLTTSASIAPTPIAEPKKGGVASTRGTTQLWKRNLNQLRDDMLNDQRRQSAAAAATGWPDDWRLIYVIDPSATASLMDEREPVLMVEVRAQQSSAKTGLWLPVKRQLDFATWISIPSEDDRLIAQMLAGSRDENAFAYGAIKGAGESRKFTLTASAYATTLRKICETGRCYVMKPQGSVSVTPVTEDDGTPTVNDNDNLHLLRWDHGQPWSFTLSTTETYNGEAIRLTGHFERHVAESEAAERMDLAEPALVVSGGMLIANGMISQLNHHGAFRLLADLRENGMEVVVFKTQAEELLQELVALPSLPPLELPAEFNVSQVEASPQPRLRIHRSAAQRSAAQNAAASPPINSEAGTDERMAIDLSFNYAGHIVDAADSSAGLFIEKDRLIVRRDAPAEATARGVLKLRGFRGDVRRPEQFGALNIAPGRFIGAVSSLVAEGWHVEADGKAFRRSGAFKMTVSSGIDWFELDGSIDFDGQNVGLPELLAAVRKGETTVLLDDGSLGVVPQDWLAKYAPLIELADAGEGQALKFSASQIGFLDALLADMPEVNVDATFAKAREQLRAFEGVDSALAPDGFIGELRPYQRDGLGWLQFLQRFNFGGCLADDMGLGKTVQVLAMLQARSDLKAGPSLVVVPRSLVFNWLQEAQRFTPDLRVLDHSGIGRVREAKHFQNFDLVVTTYGTMRRDAGYFREADFDYVILDESQAIKNASTESAKAARLLKGKHRLAMSGTPIENHLGELWSLFDFLNPGMLGGSKMLRALTGGGNAKSVVSGADARATLARALRPFILRRTKAQVARDLPEKIEQTIFCELDEVQRKLYDDLRDHYRQSLMQRIAEVGINRAKIQILEALLRLRQAACHPGLIDRARSGESSAKLDTLLSQMTEVLEEGHKVLVFSQFTSMLAILRDRLDKAGQTYEYLDGKTRDRQQRVERFQNDPTCKLFLISLKAGGVGLNLTAADYVYLLDPWWNPAVESQAIDRAHRIGQQRSVFAYRLIAKGTVEEKVLELQKSKRDLADAIINADNSVVGKLNAGDLEMLLST